VATGRYRPLARPNPRLTRRVTPVGVTDGVSPAHSHVDGAFFPFRIGDGVEGGFRLSQPQDHVAVVLASVLGPSTFL
jgi:hypothetical protein